MAVTSHRNIDLRSANPFEHVEFLPDLSGELDEYPFFADKKVETELPATPLQYQILESDTVQWCKLNLVLPQQPPPSLTHIQWTWKALTSHHTCLRTAFAVDNQSGQIIQQVRLQASEARWHVDPTWTPPSSGPSTPAESTPFEGEDLLKSLARLTVHRNPLSPFYRVTLQIHRALVDTTSLGLIRRDFALLYCGLPIPEHTPLRSYLIRHLAAKHLAASRTFWQDTLHDVTGKSSRLQIWEPVSQRSTVSMTLADHDVAGLAELEIACGWPRQILYEALWATVLHYHHSQRDVLFAASRRDASFPGVESCVGLIDQIYPVRVSVSPEETFKELFTRLEVYHAAASPHGYLGYREITRDMTAPVDSVITYAPDLGGPSLAGQLTGFPLAVFITGVSKVQITCCYNASIPAPDVDILVQHFVQALSSAARKFYLPHSIISHVELASEEEKSQIVRSAAQSARELEPSKNSVTQLFEEQVARSPERTAVEFEHDRLSFAELNAQANRVARVLGPVRGEIIPLCIDRSITLIVGILAVLKAGAAYTILDPDGATERNRRIAENCDAPVVLANRAYCAELPKARPIEDCLRLAQTLEPFNLSLDVEPEERCYLIYTSGSTGIPKGVVVSHGAATAGIQHHSLNGLQRWLLFYSPSFSAAQRTMLATLVHGGTLLLASKARLISELPAVVTEMQVEAMGITPSALSVLEPSQVPHVKQITLVGEAIPPEMVELWSGQVQLRNTFGLSECTQLNFGCILTPGSNPCIVGRPADTTRAYVLLPETTELAPIGVSGELCLAGPQLASGYLHDVEQTERAFIPNPFGLGQLYRTGDVARMHSDGSFEILGRLDWQAKIDGQKVNPAEIDQALRHHTNVGASATVVLDLSGRPRLLSAIVMNSDVPSWSDVLPSIRELAAETLPRYMIPSFWLPMKKLPTTGNGKTDVKRIQEMAVELGVARLAQFSAPDVEANDGSLDAEQTGIAEAWSEVLVDAIKAVGVHRRRGLVIELETLLDGSSVEQTAAAGFAFQKQHIDAPEAFSLVPKDAASLLHDNSDLSDAYPATPLQEGILATSLQSEGEDRYAYQRVWDVSHLDLQRLQTSFKHVFAQRDILRTSFMPHRAGFLQLVRSDLTLPWVVLDQSLEEYLAVDKSQRFAMSDLQLRLAVLSRGSQSLLVVTMHHALFDYWSHRFLYEDVAATYLGHPVPSRPSFSHVIRHLQSLPLEEYDAFWQSYLSNTEPTQLNTTPQRETRIVQQTLPIDLRQALQLHGLSPGAAIYMAWGIVLGRRTSSSEVLFATALAGRDIPVVEVEHIDGPTLNMAPLRLSIPADSSLLDLIQIVSRDLLHDRSDKERTMWQPFGKRPPWESEFTTLEVVTNDPGHLQITLTAKMEERQAQFIMESFCRILLAVLEDPHQPASAVDVIGNTEREFLSNELSNRRQLHVPWPELLQEAFERHAAGTPEAIAIDWNGEDTTSYLQLDLRANQLANELVQRHGVSVGDMIPLMLDKSVDMLVAILGVMKAGAAYVPLSPDNPLDRNAFIIGEVQARLVITQTVHSTLIPINDGLSHMHIDQLPLADVSTERPNVSVTPDQPAYVIYTSGSTGMPKGVKVPPPRCGCRGVQDFFNTLSTGGTLCLAPTDQLQSDLAGRIRTMKVRQAILTPTVAKLLDPRELPSFCTMIVGGEPLTRDVIDKWAQHELLNVYGPTETAMVVTTKAVWDGVRPSNIGAPFPTVMAFILQADGLDLVPYGGVGELCIAGPQVTDGYLNRDELTAAAFVRNMERMYRTGDLARWLPGGEIECLGRKDNQVKIHGHRIELAEIEHAIYQTGLVHDAIVIPIQVNQRTHLAAFCIFTPMRSSDIQDADGDYHGFRSQLREGLTTLTPYMMPKYVFPMGDLPKLPSRKTDRKLLRKSAEDMDSINRNRYSFDASDAQHTVVPVETVAEMTLESLWMQVLDSPAESLGKKANFLALGGDSIAAISLASRARSAGYVLSVKNILRSGELGRMAATMQVREAETDTEPLRAFDVPTAVADAIQQAGLHMERDVDYVYPSPPGQVEFLTQGARPEQMWVLMAVRRMPDGFDVDKWVEATTKLTEVDDILRSSWLRASDSQWYGVVLNRRVPTVTFARCEDEEQRALFIEAFWDEQFVFGTPFIKFAVLTYLDGACDVVIKMNHAVYDGTLLRILDDHFAAICQGLPAPAHGQFRDFALNVYRSDRNSSRAFWHKTLAGKDNRFPECENPRIDASIRRIFATDLEPMAHAAGVTIPVIFQAAYQVWLSRATARSDVGFDYLLSGRNVDMGPVDPQTVNGTLANFLPVQCSVDSTTSMVQYLQDTQDLFWAITEHGNMGLDEIYEVAGVSRVTSGNGSLFLFQPFEPSDNADELRWLVMAKSQVRMFQPYGLVVEVAKAGQLQHRLTVMYDQGHFTEVEASGIADALITIVEEMAGAVSSPGRRLGEIFIDLQAADGTIA
ncbi:hypothetical protein N7532_009739 [Penicillium argentinense]|uniref:Carrier domain-containing protein n=1 Tax=Penicillium argentinense TaxID=1131581 RepID=A0A9W9EN87_9EURO|nr:uncharacterized protein N7532_009739 [Penicillium argentinense]KAJ5084968.1 hypothetical protein N7532_009739 [Penicillium argentinense]